MLEQEALRITGNMLSGGRLSKALKWRPSGSIKVWDEALGVNAPVFGVEVRIRNWFRSWQGYTDVNGNFTSGEEFAGDVAYYLRWEYGDERFDIRNGGAGQAFYNGPDNSWDAWHLVIASGMSRVYAHIFRAGAYYIAQEPYGLSNSPFDYISVQAHDGNCPDDKTGSYSYANENIDMWSKDHSGTLFTSLRLFGIASHEFGHAHHDEMYTGGSVYTDIDEKVRESWADAIEGYFLLAVYNHSSDLKQSQTFTYMRTTGKSKYTPVFIDLVDTYNQRVEEQPWADALDMPLDCVSGYTLPQIEECLKTATTLADVKQKLKNSWWNPTEYFVDEWFAQYDNLQPASTPAITALQQGTILQVGVPVYSPNGRCAVVFQGDGNLVVYDTQASWTPVWHTGTYGRGGTLCAFQTDGNLVIYNAQSQPLWASNTSTVGLRQLAVADNGLLAICPSPNTYVRFARWAVYDDHSTTF